MDREYEFNMGIEPECKTCEWAQNVKGEWKDTQCGWLVDDYEVNIDWQFCPFCGGKIVEVDKESDESTDQ